MTARAFGFGPGPAVFLRTIRGSACWRDSGPVFIRYFVKRPEHLHPSAILHRKRSFSNIAKSLNSTGTQLPRNARSASSMHASKCSRCSRCPAAPVARLQRLAHGRSSRQPQQPQQRAPHLTCAVPGLLDGEGGGTGVHFVAPHAYHTRSGRCRSAPQPGQMHVTAELAQQLTAVHDADAHDGVPCLQLHRTHVLLEDVSATIAECRCARQARC